MPSRMDKYYQTGVNVLERTKKNQHLYDDIHNSTNSPDVKDFSNVNEISPNKLNELLNRERKLEQRAKKNIQSIDASDESAEENYDINVAIEKAKSGTSYNNDYHKISEEQINLLRKIESYKASKQEQDESLNELLNTIASTKLLKNLNDRDLSLDLLGDLKSNNGDTIVGGIDSINKVMHDITPVKPQNTEKDEIDKSFYTSSMKFSEKDFDDIKEMKQKLKNNSFWIKATIVSLFVVLVVIIVLLIVLL